MLECTALESLNIVWKHFEVDGRMLFFDLCNDCVGSGSVISKLDIVKKVRRENPVQSQSSFGSDGLKAAK